MEQAAMRNLSHYKCDCRLRVRMHDLGRCPTEVAAEAARRLHGLLGRSRTIQPSARTAVGIVWALRQVDEMHMPTRKSPRWQTVVQHAGVLAVYPVCIYGTADKFRGRDGGFVTGITTKEGQG